MSSMLAHKQLLLAICISVTVSVSITTIVTKRLLDSISTKKDWSDADWGVGAEDNALL